MIIESVTTTTPSAKLDLDMSSFDSSNLNLNEEGGDSENVVENDCVSNEEIFRPAKLVHQENFVANFVRNTFTVEERASSNVKGMLGKQRVEINSYVYKDTFRMFP